MTEEPQRLPKYSFPKQMRITHKSQLDLLFSSGESFIAYPLRVVFIKKEKTEDADVSILVSVSKRKFKRAVKRNRMKRLIRENFRLERLELERSLVDLPFSLNVAFLYLKDELADFLEIKKAMVKAVGQLKIKIQES